MKLTSLLDPTLPLPWSEVLLGPGDEATTRSVFLHNDEAFATDLVLPIGQTGEAYSKSVERLALRKNNIVIHTSFGKTSLHYVANVLMGDLPMMVKTSDYVLRLDPNNLISPASVFAQLFDLWKDEKFSHSNVEEIIGAARDQPGER